MAQNPVPFLIPTSFRINREENQYFEQLHTFLRQLWQRTGGGSDEVGIPTAPQSAHSVLIGPVGGAAAPPSFRVLTVDDLPTLSPDDIDLGDDSSPTFAELTITGLNRRAFIYADANRKIGSTAGATNGEILIGSEAALPVKATLTATDKQIVITNGPGLIQIGTPQDIDIDSNVVFNGAVLTGNTANAFLFSGATSGVSSTAAPTDGQLLIGATGADPVVANIAGTADQITVTDGPGSITLSLPQDIAPASSPTFANLAVDSVSAEHMVGAGGTPAIAAGAGAGTTPTIAITGTDLGFRVTLTTGTLPTGANAVIATATFDAAFAAPPFAVFSPSNAAAALLSGATAVFATTTNTTCVLTSGATALTAATQYSWDVMIIG